MEDFTTETFENEALGLTVRAVFLSDVPVILEDEDEPQMHDVFFWFAALSGEDRWFAYAISDTCDDGDVEESLSESDPELLKRMALYLGESWDQILSGCPHCKANRHRELLNNMPVAVYGHVSEADLDEVREMRREGEWQTICAKMEMVSQGGMKLSAN